MTGALETGVPVNGATGATVVVAYIGAGVDGITTGSDVEGGVVVAVPPFGSLPKPEIRNVILSNPDENVISEIVIPVDTIFPF